MKYLFFMIFLLSCSHLDQYSDNESSLKSILGTDVYSFEDYTGTYRLRREVKISNSKLISRNKILSSSGDELETQVAVSVLGTIKNKKGRKRISVLPEASQFTVWFDKKKYMSQSRLLKDEKKIKYTYQGGENSEVKQTEFDLNSGLYYCYFSQIPECLKLQNLLVAAGRKKVQVYIIWDNFPYNKDQYQGISDAPITLATLSLDKYNNNEFKYVLDLGNQVIFYNYDKQLEFIKMFWVSQGISMIKQGRE